MREPAIHLELDFLANDGLTILPPSEHLPLISVMAVNNEIGTIWGSKRIHFPRRVRPQRHHTGSR